MKQRIFIFAAALLVAASCSNKFDQAAPDEREIIITAYSDEENNGKTTLHDGGTSVYWQPGDEVKLFYDGTGGRFQAQTKTESRVSKFSGTLNIFFGFDEGFADDTPLWGLYPYRADAASDGESVTTTLPSEQIGKAGSFASGTYITLGKSTSLSMGFYAVCGGLRFSLTKDGVTKVIFETANGEPIAGTFKTAFEDGVPVVKEITDASSIITLTAPNSGTFEKGKWYYIVALPGTLANGFKIRLETDTQYAKMTSSSSVTFKRAKFGSVEDIDEGLIFKDKGDEPEGDFIEFADQAAKFACVAKYDTDGDGEVSYAEAEAATSFSGLFTNWKGVTSFDEIKYFKNVHSIGGLFNGCNKLESIIIPENITDLGGYAFCGCSSLTSISLPSNIAEVGVSTFQNCSSLASVKIPSNVTSIAAYAFDGCSLLTQIDLPSGITSLGSYSFCNCSKLQTINIPSNVKTIGSYAFYGCSSLTQVTIPDGVNSLGTNAFDGCLSLVSANIPSGITAIPNYCFNNCISLTSISIPEGVTSVGSNAFYGVKTWSIKCPSTVSSLGSNCFGSDIICVLLPAASPISIQSDTFSGVLAIFVPSNLIEMYKVMTKWLNYSSKLHPIGLFKEKEAFTLATSGAVDMGTSVKWAACNLDASKPEEHGGFYQWAGLQDVTSTRITLNWRNCPYHIGSDVSSGWTKYVPSDCSFCWSGSGNPDNKTILDLEDDVAHVKLGGNWRMPTHEEFNELINNCLWERATYRGSNGEMVYCLETGNKIFLPAAGLRYDVILTGDGFAAYYWSSSLDTDNFLSAYYFNVVTQSFYRYYGFSIRPVCE